MKYFWVCKGERIKKKKGKFNWNSNIVLTIMYALKNSR